MRKLTLLTLTMLLGVVLGQRQVMAQCSVSLGNDTVLCDGSVLDLSLQISVFDDSLRITYDASQGTTGLVGSPKVYMHSGAETTAGGGWQSVIGNWGADDGIGEMTNIGGDIWQITMEPFSYYGLPNPSNLEGIWMVFRNADGTLEGKDDTNTDIFLDLNPGPASQFTGVTGQWVISGFTSIQWSDGSGFDTFQISDSGAYWVQVMDTSGCTASDTIQVGLAPSPVVALGNDTGFCGTIVPFVLDAGPDGISYQWNTPNTNQTLPISAVGNYAVTVTGANGCTTADEITVTSGTSTVEIDLGNDTAICGFGALLLDPGLIFSPEGDTLTFTYDATQGVTGLIGEDKVYLHSAAVVNQGGGWEFPIGNWGDDDGLGQMISVGPDLWQISFNLADYYGYDPNISPVGLWVVFRNEDGTAEGKNNQGQDIYIDLTNYPQLGNTFPGLTLDLQTSPFTNIEWSTGDQTSSLVALSDGQYSVSVTDENNCIITDTINLTIGSIPLVDLGNDPGLCTGLDLTLDPGPGFSSYLWQDGTTTQTFDVTQSGLYSVTVTDANGCQGQDNVFVNEGPLPVVEYFPIGDGMEVTFNDLSVDGMLYQWDFDGDSIVDDTTTGTVVYTYPEGGEFNATLTVTNACTTLVYTQEIAIVGIHEHQWQDFSIYPNPTAGNLSVDFSNIVGNINQMLLVDAVGKIVFEKTFAQAPTESIIRLQFEDIQTGTYFLKLFTKDKTLIKPVIIQK